MKGNSTHCLSWIQKKNNIQLSPPRAHELSEPFCFCPVVTSFFKAENLSRPAHSEGENKTVGLVCEAGEAKAHLWGLTLFPNPDTTLCSQAGLQLAHGISGVYTGLSISQCEPLQTPKKPMSYKSQLVRRAAEW